MWLLISDRKTPSGGVIGFRLDITRRKRAETALFESDAGKALIKRVPQRRLGQLTELNGPLLLLISDAGSFMTGSVVTVDGGHMVSGL